ncbi:hypothetical protein DVH24_005714 [Malus domestica]|uniref:Uncharacterized protein n=1 Tax=Malus domestica TaxID=3750 RepID=A0A498IPR8_MALDO|nr:hypothetical protein DVH24_005714 [Malus domestica]
MSYLITRRRSVTNVTNEPTPLGEPAATASQVPISLTSSVSVEQVSALRPHRRRREPEPFDHTSSASRVEGEASQPGCKNLYKPYRWLASKSRYQYLILLHLRPQTHLALPIPSSLMY